MQIASEPIASIMAQRAPAMASEPTYAGHMPRQNRRRVDAPAASRSRSTAAEHREDWRGETYVVRTVPAAAAAKSYRCPGCDQEIRAGVPHLVAWPFNDLDAGGRRHWHAACWAAREHRGPTRR
jgi:hypothetical protein